MSVRPADPARTHAVIVGIEAYAAGSGWNLDGPSRDAFAIDEWLRAHGVPAAQIQPFVSALPQNAEVFGEAGIPCLAATSGSIRRGLNTVRERHGDLLVLFWAGHGAINQKEHRLFLADATTADKRNWSWEALRDSLTSTYFAGFPRQLVIVDACADHRNDFEFSAPGDSLPVGDPMACEQFVFFATQPGQTARNLGGERRGLFSRELLKLQATPSAASWPPDMEVVAAGVERAFEDLRAEGQATQAPRFEWRNWNGHTRDISAAPAPTAARPVASGTFDLSFAQVNGLATQLMECAPLRTEQRRNDLVRELRPDIAHRMERRSDTKSDVIGLIRTAAGYPGGLSELLQLVQAYEGPSVAWQGVEAHLAGPLRHLGLSVSEGR